MGREKLDDRIRAPIKSSAISLCANEASDKTRTCHLIC